MNNNLKFLKIFILTGILLPLVLAVFGYYFVVPRVVDFDKYKSQIRDILSRRIVYPFELGKLDIKLTWNLRARISTNNAAIRKHDSNKFLRAKNSYLEVSLLPLLNNKVMIKKISLNSFDAEITRLKDGNFDISEILALPDKPKYKVSLENTDILINGYNINFVEKFIQPSANYLFKGEKIKIDDLKPGKFIKICAKGRSVLKDRSDALYDIEFSSHFPLFKKENLRLKGKITNIEPDLLMPYINTVSDIKFLSMAKRGDVKFDLDFQEKVFGKNNFSIDSSFDGIKIETVEHGVISRHEGNINLYGKGHYNNSLIFFDNLKINSKDLNIKGSGEIKHYRNASRNNYLDIKANLSDTRVRAFALLFPKAFEIKRNPFKNILKHDVRANISGNFAIKGYSNMPQMFGVINYDDLTLFGGFENTPPASGKLDFLGSAIVIKNKVFLAKEDFVSVIGRIAPFRERTINLDITSSQADFARAQKVLFALRDFFKIKLGPVVDMDFKGRGRVNLNISGGFNDVKINGYVEGNGLDVKYATLSKPAHNVTGKIRFMGERVYYDEITGYVENQKVQPSGYSTLKGYSDAIIHIPELKLDRGLVFVNTSPLLKEVKFALKDLLKAKGTANAKIHLVGEKDKINSKGKFVLNNAAVLYRGFGGWFENLRGPLEFHNENIYFNGTTGEVKGSKVIVSGYIKKNLDSELKLVAGSLDLNSAKTFLMESPFLTEVNKVLDDYTEISGISAVEANLKGNLENEPLESLIFRDMNAVFNHKQIKLPVTLNNGTIRVEPDKVYVSNVQGTSEEIGFMINGNVSNVKDYVAKEKPLHPDFTLQVDKFDFSKVKKFTQVPLIPEKVRKVLGKFDEFHGNMEVSILAEPENISVKLIPKGISAVYTPYDTFVFVKEGKTEFSGNNIEISELKGVLSESEFDINGFIRDFKQKPEFDFAFNLDINHNDIDKIRFYSDIPMNAGGIIPFSLAVKGNVENWNVFGRMVLEKGSYLNYITDIGLPRDKVRLITLDAKGSKDKLQVERLRIDMSDSAKKIVNVADKDKSYEGFINLINVNGVISDLKSKKPLFKDFVIKTNDENSISTKLFNPSIGCLLNNGCQDFFSRGDFSTNLTLNGFIGNPEIQGNTSFKDITIPDYDAYIKSINLKFEKDTIALKFIGLDIGESKMNINANLDTKLETPVLIKNLHIDSRMFNLDQLAKIFSGNYAGKPGALPPFVITNGSLNADELVARDLITTDVRAEFNFTPDWLLTVSKANLYAAGGEGQGSALFNFSTNELSAKFDVRQMQANALATTLLTIPNEVYGTLDGNIEFSTRGKNYQELIANSNGHAEFRAKKGRFVRLGSLEYFLRAVNVIQSGVGGFNINNIIDLVAPKKTGHFETLQGRVYAKDGVLYADDITSSGKNLSLYISGKLDMLTNRADIQVLGRLSKKISGLLGPVGSVSINQFIDYIPGLGFLPATPGRKGVIDLIPALNKIPGLELNNDQKYRRFAVRIKGDLYDQGSVKSFRWIE